MKKIYNISILWGTDGFGKWLVEYILRNFSDNVSLTVTGRNIEKWETISKKLGIKFSSDNLWAVKDADIVIYSVPISFTEEIIMQTLPYLKSWAVVADVTSIKKFTSKVMSSRDDLIVIPTHPMFGPYISSIAGQVFVLTSDDKNKQTPEYQFVKNFLEVEKAKVIEATPEYHDRMMAVVQGLTHLNMFVVGETMKRLGFNIANSMDFISPIYKLMVSSVGRYVWQNPWLYADIQMYNDEVLGVHEAFLDTANNFHSSVKNKDYDKFCSDIVSAREFLWEENCQDGQEYTDKVIHLMSRQLDKLQQLQWKYVELVNIYSSRKEFWILIDFSQKEIFLEGKKTYKLSQWEVL